MICESKREIMVLTTGDYYNMLPKRMTQLVRDGYSIKHEPCENRVLIYR